MFEALQSVLFKAIVGSLVLAISFITGKALVRLSRSPIGVESFAKMRNQKNDWWPTATYRRGGRKFLHAEVLCLIGGSFWGLIALLVYISFKVL
jgi:hypothetical protein